jgi:phospholipase/carboxylesterase
MVSKFNDAYPRMGERLLAVFLHKLHALIQVVVDVPSPANVPAQSTVVLMHGYSMTPGDLSPFAASLGVTARFVFPEGPVDTPDGGKAWWAIDEVRRDREMARGGRDLQGDRPEGVPLARARVMALVDELKRDAPEWPLVLGGFSQGGMLACDVALHAPPGRIDALVLLSASRIDFEHWKTLREKLRGLPVFVSHGEDDPNLAFSTGERLADFARESGALVTWVPFQGGHEIPLTVWRGLRRFLKALAPAP